MERKDYWALFLETGAPEYYLMYRTEMKSQRGEESHVSQNSGPCAAGGRVQ